MQRFRPGLILQLTKSGCLSQAFSPLPGLCHLAAPTLCAVTAAVPSRISEVRPVTNFISLRSFAAAAEPCRVDDPQSAAEALFKVSDERSPAVYQPVTFPFFARAYYVGKTHCNAWQAPLHACTSQVLTRVRTLAGNSINLSQLNKRAQKLGYHTQVGKGMVLICAAANTKGKLTEHEAVTVSLDLLIGFNFAKNHAMHSSGLWQLQLLHHATKQSALGVGPAPGNLCGCIQIWIHCHFQWA